MSKQRTYYSGLLLLFFIAACGQKGNKPEAKQAPTPPPVINIDSIAAIVQTGDVAMRIGLGPDSYMLIQMNARDKKYSHCGVIVIENGYPFVYHCIGGEDNPGMRMRRDSLAAFFRPKYNSGFGIVRYDQDSATQTRVATAVTNYYKAAPRFDMDFDLLTEDKLYCSELVYKAELAATGDTAYINTSVVSGKRYVGIDDLYLNAHAHFVWKLAY